MISKAVLGGTVNVRTLDGEKPITIHKGMQYGEQMELSNMVVNFVYSFLIQIGSSKTEFN